MSRGRAGAKSLNSILTGIGPATSNWTRLTEVILFVPPRQYLRLEAAHSGYFLVQLLNLKQREEMRSHQNLCLLENIFSILLASKLVRNFTSASYRSVNWAQSKAPRVAFSPIPPFLVIFAVVSRFRLVNCPKAEQCKGDSDSTFLWSPLKSWRKLAWVPVVPLTPRKRMSSHVRCSALRSSSKSWIHIQARLPTVVSCAGLAGNNTEEIHSAHLWSVSQDVVVSSGIEYTRDLATKAKVLRLPPSPCTAEGVSSHRGGTLRTWGGG